MRSLILTVGLLCAAPAASAQETPEALLAGLAGDWQGALGYRDYQSNELFELDVQTHIRMAEDGRTVLRVSRFDEGDAPDVFITSASAFDPEGVYETAGFRAGRAMYATREAVALAEAQDATHWRLVFIERGMDDDRAADIRVTMTRDGDDMLSVKEVDYLEDPTVTYEFRNQTRLRRTR